MRGRRCAWLWLLVAAACVALAPMARAATAGAPSEALAKDGEEPVRAEFLADATAAVAGRAFKVGVLFHMAPEWHIYWRFPGDAGLATAVTLELPEGFVASEIQWPLPQAFVQPGDLTVYGYSDSVMLMAEVTPPKDLPVGKTFSIGAKVSWLGCRAICRPGRAELSTKLAVAAQRAPANDALFQDWIARLPQSRKDLIDAGRLRSVVASAEASLTSADTKISILIAWEMAPTKVQFFPAPTEALLTDHPSVNTSDAQSAIVIRVRHSGVGVTNGLEGLVVFTLPGGERDGFPIGIQLPAEKAAAPARAK